MVVLYVGLVSRCPGYVDVILDDWTTSEELFHYNLAVLCPPHLFNATFYLPHRALSGTTNRTFLVTLDDTKQRHHVFLTAVQHTGQTDDTQGHSRTFKDTSRTLSRTQRRQSRTRSDDNTQGHSRTHQGHSQGQSRA